MAKKKLSSVLQQRLAAQVRSTEPNVKLFKPMKHVTDLRTEDPLSDIDIRDRVVDFVRVMPSELEDHPQNWRVHPDVQRDALRGVLRKVGFTGGVLARRLPNGKLQLVDGHLRKDILKRSKKPIPVLVTDLTEAEAKLVLATVDPISALAEMDESMLGDLLRDFDPTEMDAGLQGLLNDLAQQGGLPPMGLDDETYANAVQGANGENETAENEGFESFHEGNIKTNRQCPKCGYHWSESNDAAKRNDKKRSKEKAKV